MGRRGRRGRVVGGGCCEEVEEALEGGCCEEETEPVVDGGGGDIGGHKAAGGGAEEGHGVVSCEEGLGISEGGLLEDGLLGSLGGDRGGVFCCGGRGFEEEGEMGAF